MATVYIKPGTGTGTGTLSDPYFFSQLATAETAASNTQTEAGTIYFTDGTYTLTGTLTLNEPDITYESLNLHSAILDGGTVIKQLNYNCGNALKKFYIKQCDFVNAAGTGTAVLEDLKVECATAFAIGTGGYITSDSGARATTLTRCSFYLVVNDSSANSGWLLKTSSGNTALNHVTMYIDASAAGADAIKTDGGTNTTYKNMILSSSTSTAFSTNFVVASRATNCCIHNVDNNTSGGTNNVFADPQFVDSANGDFRLRPSSPCINAGTAS